ncbi:hypothetical protein NKZ99_004257 [Salmonella enterica]|nr:hypothetical protein [Salmonella enterica]
MRDAVGLMWMLAIQLVGCYMAYWITPAVIFLLVATLLWQTLFCYANYRVRQTHVGKIKDVSPVIYLLLSVPAIFFPTFSFPIFGWLSVYRLVKIAGVSIGDRPVSYYLDGCGTGENHQSFSFQNKEAGSNMSPLRGQYRSEDIHDYSSVGVFDDYFQHDEHVFNQPEINPATGLIMTGPIDVGGNLYGISDDYHISDDHHSYDDHNSYYDHYER